MEVDMDEEELAELNEQLAAARVDIERLQAEAADAQARAYAATEDMQSLRSQLDGAAERERADAARYREVVLSSDPSLPVELIDGDTIEAVDASVEAARAMVGRIRTHLEAQSKSTRVPAGAPPRSAPDFSAMTPQEKIRYGLEHRG
jgi:septal ring factor EnvC (AmiA/AmiB activator)